MALDPSGSKVPVQLSPSVSLASVQLKVNLLVKNEVYHYSSTPKSEEVNSKE